jgi:glycine/D-amino acid oxidase-like deaminating enzyme
VDDGSTGKVAVIGAGVIGACIGYYLTRAGTDVLLVDAGNPGALTTSATFAWVNASNKADHRAYFDLNAAGLAEYEWLAAELGDATWWHQTGHLRWDYEDDCELARLVERVRARGYPAELWDTARAKRELEPCVNFAPPSRRVALFPSEGWVDGPQMVRALVDAAVSRGATTAFGSAVRAITHAGATVSSIELDNGERHSVKRIVNAAGPGAARVARLVDRDLPMEARPGLAIRLHAPGNPIRRVLHSPGVAIRPDGEARVFLLVRDVEVARSQDSRIVDEALRSAATLVPALTEASVADVRVGFRPIPADGFPMLGAPGGIGGYYEAVTHSGITLGPVIGRALAEEIVHGRIHPLTASFRANRLW